jgi:hypothetical protein
METSGADREATARGSAASPDVAFSRWLALDRAGSVFNPEIRVIRG